MGFYSSSVNCLGIDADDKSHICKITVNAYDSLNNNIKLSDVSNDLLEVINDAIYLNQQMIEFSNDLSIKISSKYPIAGHSCGIGVFLCIFSALHQLKFKDNFFCTGVIDREGFVLPVEALDKKLAGFDITDKTVLMSSDNIGIIDKSNTPKYLIYISDIREAIICAFECKSLSENIDKKYGHSYLYHKLKKIKGPDY